MPCGLFARSKMLVVAASNFSAESFEDFTPKEGLQNPIRQTGTV